DKRDRSRSGASGAALKLTPIEEHAAEVGERYFQYQALRDHDCRGMKPLDLLVVPRPSDETYRKYSTEVFEKGLNPDQTLSPLAADVSNTLVEYLEGIPSKNWALPAEDAIFDQLFAVWLFNNSRWMPLGIILHSDESELALARMPVQQ